MTAKLLVRVVHLDEPIVQKVVDGIVYGKTDDPLLDVIEAEGWDAPSDFLERYARLFQERYGKPFEITIRVD